MPPTDFREGFVLWRGIGVDYEGGVLDGASRIAIQMAHRMFAVVVAVYLLWLAVRLYRLPSMRGWASALGLLVVAQITLGILNVKLAVPLVISPSWLRKAQPVVVPRSSARMQRGCSLDWVMRDLLFAFVSEASGLAGEGCGLARPRRVVWSVHGLGSWAARQILQYLQRGVLKDFRP